MSNESVFWNDWLYTRVHNFMSIDIPVFYCAAAPHLNALLQSTPLHLPCLFLPHPSRLARQRSESDLAIVSRSCGVGCRL